eukprot:215262_1
MTRTFDASNCNNICLKYSFSYSHAEGNENIYVKYSCDDGINWITYQYLTNKPTGNDYGMSGAYNLDPICDNNSNLMIRFEYHGNDELDRLYVDNVYIYRQCSLPTQTLSPTHHPTSIPTIHPTNNPTKEPTIHPTIFPTIFPTNEPTFIPTQYPSIFPTLEPTTTAPTTNICAFDDMSDVSLWTKNGSVLSSSLSTRCESAKCIFLEYNNTNPISYMTRTFDASNCNNICLKYSFSYSHAEGNENIYVKYSCDDGINWITYQYLTNKPTGNDYGMSGAYNLDPICDNNSNLMIRFEYHGNDELDRLYVDNVYMYRQCSLPTQTLSPTNYPTIYSTNEPTFHPTNQPTIHPTVPPTNYPTFYPIVPTIQTRPLQCGDIIKGNTTDQKNSHYYDFSLYDASKYGDGVEVIIDLCKSNYDIFIYFYDENGQEIAQNDDHGISDCPRRTSSMLIMNSLHNGHYLILITGFENRDTGIIDTGNYTMQIICTHNNVYPPHVFFQTPNKYRYLYYDQLNTLSNWETNEYASIVSSPNCPSLVKTQYDTSLFAGRKICIANSYTSFWDGQYEFKYFDKNINGSIYYHTKLNKYIYEYSVTSGSYKYYFNDYTDLMLTECNNVDRVNDCTGKWRHFMNNEWLSDYDMITTECNDICIYGDNLYIPNASVFEYFNFDVRVNSNIYRCKECESQWYLGPRISSSGYHRIYISTNYVYPQNAKYWYDCHQATNEFVFEIDQQCYKIDAGDWSYENLQATQHCSPEQIESNYTSDSFDTSQNNKICITRSNNSDINGQYYLEDHNYIYYNSKNNMYIHQNFTDKGEFEYHIRSMETTEMLLAKCTLSTAMDPISYCVGKWEIYYKNTKRFDEHMISTACQDVCINSNHNDTINGVYVFSHFNITRRTNIYQCDECNRIYLFGWMEDQLNARALWKIGTDYDAIEYISECYAGAIKSTNNDYAFNIVDCFNENLWTSDVAASYCKNCIEAGTNAELYRTYYVNQSYQHLAIGFDANSVSDANTELLIYYSCNQTNNAEQKLLTLHFDRVNHSIDNFVYNLPEECDNISNISVKFSADDQSQIYIDNIYLYYNVDQILFIDNMDQKLDWKKTPESSVSIYNSSVYCESAEFCSKLNVPSEQNSAYVTKIVNINNNGYNYKDFNLKWSLRTNNWTKDSTVFKVGIQCDNNYLYAYDLCTLKTYDSKYECHINSCYIQSYNLPTECNLASEIIIGLYMESSSTADSVYIDYVQLTHSDLSGIQSGNCSNKPAITPAPTLNMVDIEHEVWCGDIVFGSTTTTHHIKYYQLNYLNTINSDSKNFVDLDLCESFLETEVILYDENLQKIGYNHDSPHCNKAHRAKLTMEAIENGKYIIAILGYSGEDHGEYTLRVTCDYSHTTSPTAPTQTPTDAPSNKYRYLYHDRLNVLSNWHSHGNVSIVTSPKCPLNADNTTLQFGGSKICVSNSLNNFWNGEYEWKYYDKTINALIYYNTGKNKYLYQYITSAGYEHYFNDYENDEIKMTRCIVNSTDIRDCNENWQHYHGTYHEWYADIDMITLTCNDICVFGNDVSDIPDGTRFVWREFDTKHRSNVYRYKCTTRAYCYIYLYGWTYGSGKYQWQIDGKSYTSESSNQCDVGFNLGDSYIFDVNDCSAEGLWGTLSGGSWPIDQDMRLVECRSNNDVENQFTSDDDRVCVSGFNNSNIHLNGEYILQYFNERVGGSIYYNLETRMYIYPYMTESGHFQYHIHSDESNGKTYAKCDIYNLSPFAIADCIGKWAIYQNDTWTLNPNVVTTPCQDICIYNNDKSWMKDGATFVYHHFDKIHQSNVYKCDQCVSSSHQGYYLKGFIRDDFEYEWQISSNYTKQSRSSRCKLGKNLTVTNSYYSYYSYVFSINDCLNVGSWETYNGGWDNDDMYALKCNGEQRQICAKLKPNSQLFRRYYTNEKYQDYAVGLDISIFSKLFNALEIKYSCHDSNTSYKSLTTLDFNHQTRLTNFVHTLPKQCDNVSFISIQFDAMSGSSRRLINEEISDFYLDNIYLYYDVHNTLFYDEMDGSHDWINSYVFNSSKYCSSDNYCFKMFISPTTGDDTSVTKTININKGGYLYKELNIEWSLITSGLATQSKVYVEIQCSKNFLHVYDLCVLKQYDFNNDCNNINAGCRIQSYNLPLECDFSTQILIKFHLQSTTFTDEVYVDYVKLKHSDTSGKIAPLCRTSAPTKNPTQEPTLEPTKSPYNHTALNEIFSTMQWILIVTGVFILCICMVIYVYIRNKMSQKAKEEMVIKNAMVILVAVGEYDDDPENADPDLEDVHLPDLQIDQDLVNLTELFGSENLNYSIFPDYGNMEYQKKSWTEEEIINLLKKQAKQLHEDRNKYDGLVVAISGHGYSNNICTSDYKTIDKVAIHRLFSADYAESREIPRIFLFDCCDGGEEHGKLVRKKKTSMNKLTSPPIISADVNTTQSTPTETDALNFNTDVSTPQTPFSTEGLIEQGKNFRAENIVRKNSAIWDVGTKNPDHLLVEIHAANSGFQAKMSSDVGSYMLYEFVVKTLQDLNENSKKYKKIMKTKRCIYEVFDDIQRELANRGKQQIISIYNNQTRYITFQRNDNEGMKKAEEVLSDSESENITEQLSDEKSDDGNEQDACLVSTEEIDDMMRTLRSDDMKEENVEVNEDVKKDEEDDEKLDIISSDNMTQKDDNNTEIEIEMSTIAERRQSTAL